MFKITDLDKTFCVSGQISPDDIDDIASRGITLVVSMRPDNEETGQPSASDLAKQLNDKGISFAHIPVKAGIWIADDVSRLSNLLDEVNGQNVLGFCKSGLRAAAMWVLSTHQQDIESGIKLAKSVNIDLSKMKLHVYNKH